VRFERVRQPSGVDLKRVRAGGELVDAIDVLERRDSAAKVRRRERGGR
jgi:hypothetical protein